MYVELCLVQHKYKRHDTALRLLLDIINVHVHSNALWLHNTVACTPSSILQRPFHAR